ncbi:MAG: coproporphyrinogen III oxidase, partial [Pseudomonadota bacterium]
MTAQALPDSTLIERYGVTGPRYTSYPSALEFSPDIGDAELAAALAAGNDELIPPPLSLYVHIPFCRSLCYYCGCEKKVTRSAAVVSGYLQTLGREIAAKSALIDSDRQVRQLHLGGGTPTYLDAAQRRELLTTLRRHFRFVDDPDLDGVLAVRV